MTKDITKQDRKKSAPSREQGVSFHSVDHQLSVNKSCVLVCPEVYEGKKKGHAHIRHRPMKGRLDELCGLAEAIDLQIIDAFGVKIKHQHPGTFLRAGTVKKLRIIVDAHPVALVVVDTQLSPVQQRNLEKAIGTKVLDRTGLIFEIFGHRAHTREGVLQVELAHLSYQKGRLVRSWTHLERQRGGAAFMGGPGETQIEADRRQLSHKIQRLKKAIAQVRKNRAVQRQNRLENQMPTVALVGYTNAGKSTLFNQLTQAGVLQKDQLFATLDTTHRKISLPGRLQCLLSDTVGFVSDLPTELVAAFHATLEDVGFADIILHVHDASHDEWLQQHYDVIDVLETIGIVLSEVCILNVWNKWDLVTKDQKTERLIGIRQLEPALKDHKKRDPLLISAQTGQGIDDLMSTLMSQCTHKDHKAQLIVPADHSHHIHWLYGNAHIVTRQDFDDGRVWLHCLVPQYLYRDFIDLFGSYVQ